MIEQTAPIITLEVGIFWGNVEKRRVDGQKESNYHMVLEVRIRVKLAHTQAEGKGNRQRVIKPHPTPEMLRIT